MLLLPLQVEHGVLKFKASSSIFSRAFQNLPVAHEAQVVAPGPPNTYLPVPQAIHDLEPPAAE